ncbi:hypothetical protein ACLD55_00985 [Gardnerella vaginalis]|uniref:hypothetical protein n=1 Tax=Gardnerella vaginalis TaxID=2702 RepID=UPI0039710656
MMNKKAIAAFAAGATLLAGFAMATPAFAGAKGDALADAVQIHEANKTLRESQRAVRTAEISLVKLQSAQAAAKTAYENAKTKFDAAKKAAEAAKKAVEDGLTAYLGKHVNDKDFDKTKATAEYKQSEEYKSLDKANTEAEAKLKDTDAEGKTLEKKAEDLKTALDAADAKVTAQTEAVAAAKAQVEANQRYLNALRGVNPGGETKPDQTKPGETKPDQTKPDQTKPVQTADPSKSAASAELMRTQVVLAEADATNKDAQEKFVKAKADFEAAKTQMAALDAPVKSAADREEALRVAGKTDTDAYKAAVIDLKTAQSKANAYRTHEYADAEKNFGEKSDKALLAATAYNTALVNYRAAFNKAVEVEASAVKGFADPNTLNPVSTDFPAASAAAKAEAKKVEAKAQTAAPAAGKAGAAAAAKGELAAKGGNGHGKSGEKLGNAGVGVALTALAASMLAGMGAAVRKMRH